MYGGLALSQNTQIVPRPDHGRHRQPAAQDGRHLRTSAGHPDPLLRTQRRRRSRAARSSPRSTSAALTGKTGIVSVPIEVTSPDPRITVLGYDPPLRADRTRPPRVEDRGPGLGRPRTGPRRAHPRHDRGRPATVTISGAQSLVSQVVSVRADVIIQSTGIDVDEDVRLVPIDKQGNAIRPLEVTPPTARVKIPVFSDRQTRTLPVNPIITGRRPPGSRSNRSTRRPASRPCRR